ncbi:MAG: hypothetical protein K9J21_07070, partial [Bacteroidales bacterium]|nr:hypothetical protein [Bacteroidales bacterium]
LINNGEYITVTDKNKTHVYASDNMASYLIHQDRVWDGSAWIGTHNYGFGHYALRHNTGARSNGFGYLALQNNTGDYSNGFGDSALRHNTGARSNGFGYLALQNNTGDYSNGFGLNALQSNTGDYSNGFGYLALQSNTGARSNGFGYNALQNNTGDYSNGFGYNALQNNTGDYSNGFGDYALRHNTSIRSNGFGYYALQNNTGDYSNGFGLDALRHNTGDYNTALGNSSFNNFDDNTSAAKDISSLDPANNRVTITGGHGFGNAGEYINLRISTDGTLPSGLYFGIDQWEIIDSETLESRTDGFSDSGTGTHTLTPPYIYSNSTALGYNAEPDASNQVVLGNSNVTEVKTSGIVSINGTGDNYFQGNVGIVTTSPSEALDVNGNILASDTIYTTNHGNSANWQTAYNERGSQIDGANLNWDGAELDVTGVVTDETDPVFTGHLAYDITETDTTHWGTDADATNEIQDISTDGTAGNISISSGSTLNLNVDDADADPNNEIQSLSLTNDTLFLSQDGNVNLDKYLDNTDNQTLSTDGTAGDISIENGNGITLNVDDADNTIGNEYQDLSTDGTSGNVQITDGTNVNINVDDADASQSNELQDLSIDSTGRVFDISLSSDGTVSFEDTYIDNDNDPSNEYNTGVNWDNTNNDIEITDGGGTLSATITGFLESETDPVYSGDPASSITASNSGEVITTTERNNLTDAYNERGSQIAGTNLSWDGSDLNATNTGNDEVYGLIRYQSASPTTLDEKVYVDSDNNTLKIYDGGSSSWIDVGGGGTSLWKENTSNEITPDGYDHVRINGKLQPEFFQLQSDTSWTNVYSPSIGTFFSSFEIFRGELYSGAWNGAVYKLDGKQWQLVDTISSEKISTLRKYQSRLYAGGAERDVYEYDGVSWDSIYTTEASIYSSEVYNNKLYIGDAVWGNIYEFDGSSWQKVHYNIDDKTVWALEKYNGKLYAGIRELTAPNRTYEYDGNTFNIIREDTTTTRSLAAYNGYLYLGNDEGIIYKYDGNSWTQSYNTGQSSVRSMQSYNNCLYAGTYNNDVIYEFDGNSWTTDYTNIGTVYGLGLYNGKLYAGNSAIYRKSTPFDPINPEKKPIDQQYHFWKEKQVFGDTVKIDSVLNIQPSQDLIDDPNVGDTQLVNDTLKVYTNNEWESAW